LEVIMIETDGSWRDIRYTDNVSACRPGMFRKRGDELRAMASQLRTFSTRCGELEIWMHNWARVLERVALEMECLDHQPAEIRKSPTFHNHVAE